jgi:hypothetical protein
VVTLHMATTLSRRDIDINDVLVQTEQALEAAQDILPSSASVSITKEWTDITEMKNQIDEIMDRDQKNEASQILQNLANGLSHQVSEAVDFAHHQLEQEEDLSKVPEKMVLAVQSKANEEIEGLVNRAHCDFKELIHNIEGLREAPKKLEKTFQATVTKDNLKKAPGRAFKAFEKFVGSDEVKNASNTAAKSIKNALFDKMKQKRPQLIDVSDRDIDISDVLAEAEAALMAVEVTASAASNKREKKKSNKVKSGSLFRSIMKPKASQLIEASDRDIDISDVLAEAEPALVTAEIAEVAVSSKKEKRIESTKIKPKSGNIFKSIMQPKTPQLVDISDRDIDISDVIAEAEAALMAAGTVEPRTSKKEEQEKKINSDTTNRNLFEIVAPETIELIGVNNRNIDITDILTEADAALMAAETADPVIGKIEKTKSKTKNSIVLDEIVSEIETTSETTLALSEVVSFVNARLRPIRKSNQAILAHTLSESVLLQKQLLIESRDRIILFAKATNDQTSPIRKYNRAALVYSVTEVFILQKELLKSGHDEIVSLVKAENARMKPIRVANRSILRHTLIEAMLLQKELLNTALNYLKTQNDHMKPIRAANRANLIHNIVEFWKVQKDLAGAIFFVSFTF